MSHMGRPNGAFNQKHSLKLVQQELSRKLGCSIKFAEDCVSEEARAQGNELRNGEILLLENLRFHKEEERQVKDPLSGAKEKVDPEKVNQFCQKLSEFGDLYVNDAFGTCHRAHSSIVGTNHAQKASGLLLEKEIHVKLYLADIM